MNQALSKTWNEVADKIKSYDDTDSSQVDAFFPRLQPQAMSSDFIMLTTDTSFIKTWMESHYIDHIKRALKDLYGNDFVVCIEIDPSQEVAPLLRQNGQSSPAQTARGGDKNSHMEQGDAASNHFSISENEPKNDCGDDECEDHGDLSSTLTFGNFVIGESNQMAHRMAVSVAEVPGGKPSLNPLFIYGKSGLGKTHLLRAIQNYIRKTYPHLKTIYVDSSEFINDYAEAALANDKDKQSYKNFKRRYENADVLLIDDVQFLQGKTQTLNMIFNIFNKLITQGKQVVLSADRAPKTIDIDERYQSRFSQGGICDIQPPETETKLGIIKKFIEEYNEKEDSNFEISNEIQLYVAENSSSNIRELKSAVTKIICKIQFGQSELTTNDVRILLEDHFSGGPSKRLMVADIQKEVELYYRVSHSEIVGNKRSRNITHARQVAMYLCRKMLDLPFGEIGKKFNRDHSTIMYSVGIIDEKIKDNRDLREEIETIRRKINEA